MYHQESNSASLNHVAILIAIDVGSYVLSACTEKGDNMYACIYMYVCMYGCVYVCMFLSVSKSVCLYVYMHVRTYVCMYVSSMYDHLHLLTFRDRYFSPFASFHLA